MTVAVTPKSDSLEIVGSGLFIGYRHCRSANGARAPKGNGIGESSKK